MSFIQENKIILNFNLKHEYHFIHFSDVHAISYEKNDSEKEKNKAIEILAKKFQVEEVHQNIRIKIEVLKNSVEKYNLSKEEFVYIGDDINDLECLNFAKYKITVPHAVEKVKAVENIQITENSAGNGAFREVADCLIG